MSEQPKTPGWYHKPPQWWVDHLKQKAKPMTRGAKLGLFLGVGFPLLGAVLFVRDWGLQEGRRMQRELDDKGRGDD